MMHKNNAKKMKSAIVVINAIDVCRLRRQSPDGFGCILRSLLFEADFFVDEKDLQTFVGATSQSRFFLPLLS
jgi:hypothetical protein